jgi:hypothetical protein
MSKKTIKLVCLSCDIEYTIKYSEEELKVSPDICPFCGDEIEHEDDSDSDEEEESENDDSNDRWS